MSPGTADPEHDGECQHPACEQHDVLARDREQVIEARAPKRLLGPIGQPSVVAEQHAFDERAPFSRQPGRGRAPKPTTQPIGNTTEPAALPDDVPLVHMEDDVHALPA